ncbi:MAG: thioredoxin family protein [Syntrophobacteraceae bacterium]|nr:thioredoxin family protein [Syntrophobacteraceae bacterium]
MEQKDIARIRVGKFTVGIMGLGQLLEEMSASHEGRSDEEMCAFMLAELGRSNYIPAGARADYGRAFVREFRKFLGQPCLEEAPGELEVKVLGAGCAQCTALTHMVMEVLTELNLPATVDHVTDLREIARYGIMGSPALLINGRAVSVGSVPPRQKVGKWLAEASRAVKEKR